MSEMNFFSLMVHRLFGKTAMNEKKSHLEDPLFQDPDMETEFRMKGYVLRPFLDSSEIKKFQDLYETIKPEMPADIYVTVLSQDREYKRRIYEGICEITSRSRQAILPEHDVCITSFAIKGADSKSGSIAFHQDWSFVDTDVHRAVNIWCPLIDVNEQNGCLKVIPGSHRLFSCFGISTSLPPPFAPVKNLLDSEFTVKLAVRSGWAVVYDSRLVHGSDENRTHTTRVALICATIPKNTTPRLYYRSKDEPDKLSVFEVNKDFFFDYRPATEPNGVRLIDSIKYNSLPMRPEDLSELARYQKAGSSI